MSPGDAKADEQGYALVAAIASIAVFAAMALAITTATRISIAHGSGELAAARAHLAAAGAIDSTLHALAQGDETVLALLQGGQMSLDLDGAHATVRLADERGKIPLNRLEDAAVDRMLTNAGMDDGERVIARDSLLDWLDDDDLARADGAEAPFYATRGIAPRNGQITTIDELAVVRGFTPQLVARLRPYVTAEPDMTAFDSRYASPNAIAVMDVGGEGSPAAINRQREAAGQRTAFQFLDPATLTGRPITIAVDATSDDGGRAHDEAVVVLTGRPAHPWTLRRVQ